MTRDIEPAKWLECHGDVLWRYAIVRVRDPELTEELIQQTLVAALESAEHFRGECSERTWLVSILQHKIADHSRRASRRARTGPGPGPMAEMYDEKGSWRRDPGKPPKERVLESPEFWRDLEHCLEKMPLGLAEAFVMREVRAADSRAICAAMGISRDNLWVRLHRARILLKDCLGRRWSPGRKRRKRNGGSGGTGGAARC